jgi:hypothetical protein
VPYPVQIWPNPSRHCRATTLQSSHHIGDTRADSSLGGGSPTYTITVRGVLGAGVPLDAAPIVVEDRQSRAIVASLERAISAAVSLQNECMLASRSRRKIWIIT